MNNHTTFNKIINIISDEMGLDPESLGDLSLKTSLRSLMLKSDIKTEDELLGVIRSDTNMILELIEEVKVPETWFFRDREAFNYLKKYAQNYKITNKNSKLKILSAPCSTGEEAYSIAISLLESGFAKEHFNIVATDISMLNLNKARLGIYSKSSLRSLAPEVIDKYFSGIDNKYEIKLKATDCNIDFIRMNLIKEFYKIPNNEYNIIFFKNLLIYLNENSRQYILTNIKRALKPDGVLFVGVSEVNYFLRNGFEAINHNLSFACKLAGEKKQILTSVRKVDRNIKPVKVDTERFVSKQESNIPILKPNDTEVCLKRIKECMDEARFNEAEQLIDDYITNEQYKAELYFMKGVIKYVGKVYDAAKQNFTKSLYLNPNDYESLIYMSLVEIELGNNVKAEYFRFRAEKVFNRQTNE
ncbi:MAG TPA: CheR family methyltransferase [Candidatus Kapabacteria bacterium]|nr:CheR family methyltransferase [Candidatus Kapabacteria bacterium]